MTGRDCLAGETVELPPLTLVGGGFISGRVVNTATGEPVSVTEKGEPIAIGFYGPSHPRTRVIDPVRFAETDKLGRFTLHVAAGENFPYLVNTRGDRMAWDTHEKPAVIVKEGETTTYDMLITPKVTPAERLEAARKLVANLPEEPAQRARQILLEFRKLNRTVDEAETWCLLMRELAAIGREAVPLICAELDLATDDRTLRRLAFALRAIGGAPPGVGFHLGCGSI